MRIASFNSCFALLGGLFLACAAERARLELVPEHSSSVRIEGKALLQCSPMPARGRAVSLVDATGRVIASDVSAADGAFLLRGDSRPDEDLFVVAESIRVKLLRAPEGAASADPNRVTLYLPCGVADSTAGSGEDAGAEPVAIPRGEDGETDERGSFIVADGTVFLSCTGGPVVGRGVTMVDATGQLLAATRTGPGGRFYLRPHRGLRYVPPLFLSLNGERVQLWGTAPRPREDRFLPIKPDDPGLYLRGAMIWVPCNQSLAEQNKDAGAELPPLVRADPDHVIQPDSPVKKPVVLVPAP